MAIRRQDFFPNYMSWRLVLTANDTFTTDKIFTPIPRNQAIKGNRAVVMELLWLDVDVHNLKLLAADDEIFWGISTGNVPTKLITLDAGNCLAYGSIECLAKQAGSEGFGISSLTKPQRYDMQTKDGYGLLLASDAFNFYADSLNTGEKIEYNCRLYYRFVQIPVTEFIGLVQSQQSN